MSAVSSIESKRGSETSALGTLIEARDGTGNDDPRACAARKGKQRTTRDVFPRDPMFTELQGACREICYTAATAQHSSVQAKRCLEAERTALSKEWDDLLLDSLERQRDAKVQVSGLLEVDLWPDDGSMGEEAETNVDYLVERIASQPTTDHESELMYRLRRVGGKKGLGSLMHEYGMYIDGMINQQGREAWHEQVTQSGRAFDQRVERRVSRMSQEVIRRYTRQLESENISVKKRQSEPGNEDSYRISRNKRSRADDGLSGDPSTALVTTSVPSGLEAAIRGAKQYLLRGCWRRAQTRDRASRQSG
jgi:hypothetical protein